MKIYEIILIGIGLAMDAFAVSICKGLSMKKMNWNDGILIAIYFGVFQALMPFLGYFLGTTFSNFVENVDHWIAFILLNTIGVNMIKETICNKHNNEKDKKNDNIDVKTMLVLAIATSIDALAVGVTFAFLKVNIILAITLIGIITFCLSLIGVKIGNSFGDKFETKAQFTGGIILIVIGLKILLDHLGVLNF